MGCKTTILTVLIFLLLIGICQAETFSVDPCQGATTLSEDIGNIYLDSPCFNIVFPKDYSTPISFYDSYNDDAFDLKVYSLLDVNDANPVQRRTTSFEDIDMAGSIVGDTVVFQNATGNIKLIYSVQGNKVKAGLEVHNWVSNYPVGRLTLRTRIHKEDTADSHFLHLPATVDGTPQPTTIEEETAGVNVFSLQTIFVGNSFTYLEIDPIYQVDYSPSPGEHLQEGYVITDSDSSFTTITNITPGLSDNNTATTYTVGYFGQTNSTTVDYTDGGYDGQLYVSANSEILAVDFPIPKSSIYGDYIQVCARASRYSVAMTSRLTVNTTFYGTTIGLPVGTSPSTFTCKGLPVSALSEGTNRIGLGCYSGCGGAQRLYLSTDSTSPDSNSYYWNLVTWAQQTTYDYAIKITYNFTDNSTGNAIKGTWSQTYDPMYSWFVSLYKTSTGSANTHVYAYLDSDNISSTSVNKTFASTGWFTINVSSLLDYQLNTLGLNYTSLRIYTDTPHNISELMLRKEVNDTIAPVVTDCQTNDTIIYCNETARLQCNITDNIDVDDVLFTLNNQNFSTVQEGDIFYYDFTPTCLGFLLCNWSYVYAQDVVGLETAYEPNITFNRTCCYENWTAQYGSCLLNDTQFKYYIDANNCSQPVPEIPVPGDNGTYVACNYCSEDLVCSPASECYWNGTAGQQDYTCVDNNYFGCCIITGLVSDCSIMYAPYNDTYQEDCIFLTEEFEIELDAQVYFGLGLGGLASDKVFGKIWLNDTNNTYKCLTYVKDEDGILIQVNPPYTKRTTGTITLWGKEIEDREFFSTQNGLANVYWTDDNLVIDGREYVFGVECAGNGVRLRSEKSAEVNYMPVSKPITRFIWGVENLPWLMLGLFGAVVLMIIVVGIVRAMRR